MISAPPFETGAVQETTDWPLSFEVALTAVGAPGRVDGTAVAEATDTADVPLGFVAVTVKVYLVPFVRPIIVQVNAPVVEHFLAPGADVTE